MSCPGLCSFWYNKSLIKYALFPKVFFHLLLITVMSLICKSINKKMPQMHVWNTHTKKTFFCLLEWVFNIKLLTSTLLYDLSNSAGFLPRHDEDVLQAVQDDLNHLRVLHRQQAAERRDDVVLHQELHLHKRIHTRHIQAWLQHRYTVPRVEDIHANHLVTHFRTKNHLIIANLTC